MSKIHLFILVLFLCNFLIIKAQIYFKPALKFKGQLKANHMNTYLEIYSNNDLEENSKSYQKPSIHLKSICHEKKYRKRQT